MRVEPSPEDPEAITEALCALRNGAPDAMDRLTPLVYERLRRIAHRQLRAEPVGHTLSTTALVHEAYLKLVDQTRAEWQDRGHFFAVASGAMRRILVDYARQHRRAKRGGGLRRVTLDESALSLDERSDNLIALDEALTWLAELNPRLSRVVEYRFFAGLTEEEIAEATGVTVRTVKRDWAKARAGSTRSSHHESAE
jgi:RNA polymerase sigma factor (TIGR02999 family)